MELREDVAVTPAKFLRFVDRFCEEYGVAPSAIGREALRDASFFAGVRVGTRNPGIVTVQRVLSWMKDYQETHRAVAGGDSAGAAEPKPDP